MSEKIKNNILSRVRDAKYYSIISDCTPNQGRNWGGSRGPDPPEIFKSRNILAVNIVY
jgi:hypothetical protein